MTFTNGTAWRSLPTPPPWWRSRAPRSAEPVESQVCAPSLASFPARSQRAAYLGAFLGLFAKCPQQDLWTCSFPGEARRATKGDGRRCNSHPVALAPLCQPTPAAPPPQGRAEVWEGPAWEACCRASLPCSHGAPANFPLIWRACCRGSVGEEVTGLTPISSSRAAWLASGALQSGARSL